MKHLRTYITSGLFLIALLLLGTTANAEEKKIILSVTPGSDISKPLQKALNEAANDTSDQNTYDITVPAGSYTSNGLLKVFSNTTIHLNGVTITRQNHATMLRFGYETTDNKGYEGIHDVTFDGGCFDGNGKGKSITDSLIRIGHSNNITFKNVTFRNVVDSHHVELAACSNVLFQNCTFKDFYSLKNITNSGNNEALQFDILHNSKHFPKYPTFDDTPCKNITVTGCTFDNLQRGLGTHSAVAGSYFTNMKFTNNTFRNIRGYAIKVTNYINSDISDNNIQNCGAGILFQSMQGGYSNYYAPLSGKATIINNLNSTIERNTITVIDQKYKNIPYGIYLYGEKLKSKKKDVSAGDYSVEGITVRNNKITMKNSGYGIKLQRANNCLIDNNSVTMNIVAKSSGEGNSDCIRALESTKTTISNNSLTHKKNNKKTRNACGIVLTDKSNLTLKNNKITNTPKDGIFVNTKSKANITRNTIKKTGRYGLNVIEKSTVKSKKNTITNCKKGSTSTWDGGKIKKIK